MTAATVRCSSCGAEPIGGARFCHDCGSSLREAPGAAEYKHVTVLFADVERSMGLAAAVDVERLREIMTELMERSAAVVRRFGGTVEYNGDGVMALFGAPAALEDHAFRGCLAGLAIQEEATRLAADVQRLDNVTLRLRIGLNSGRVIVGPIGTGSLGYRAIGEPVGLAQRMESVAPSGGVMLSEATARLVEDRVLLAEPEWVLIKGADEPVRARRLLGIGPREHPADRVEASLVGREREMAALAAAVERAIGGSGGVVRVVGPPGIGKSRVAREAAAIAAARGVDVGWTFCESHAQDIPFYAVSRLLQASFGVVGLDPRAARETVRTRLPGTDSEDLLLLDDTLGIADQAVPLPQIDPDARRRRLTALVNAASVARTEASLFVIEDGHWIDSVSESLLLDFLAVIDQTPVLVLVTYRPEYRGALSAFPGSQSICLEALDDSCVAELLGDVLGADPSVADVSAAIADRSAGNPFFAEEMVRELVQRGVLAGRVGHYVRSADSAELTVPATVQAAIEARIDGLAPPAKRTLNAASVIGARFSAGLLAALNAEPALGELVDADFIDPVTSPPGGEYAFRHPLIRAVAYESQLKSDRAEWHRRLAAAIEQREPESVEENAAMIAEHLQAAGELPAAYAWHMRAAAWSGYRDVAAARHSWESARRIGDRLDLDGSDGLALRIAPRTMLCATIGWGDTVHESRSRFAELRELCQAADDKVSLAVGMTGVATELLFSGRSDEGAPLVSEQFALLESIADSSLTMGLAFIAFCNWFDAGRFGELLRGTQTVIALADGDPIKGAGFGIGSPLAAALAWRASARWWLGRPGWRADLEGAVDMARSSTPETLAAVVAWTYGLAIQYGVLRPDDSALLAAEQAVKAGAGSNNVSFSLGMYALAVALLCRDDAADRQRGLELMEQASDIFLRARALFLMPVTELWCARERAIRGERDAAVPAMRKAVAELHDSGRSGYGVWATGVLVETLLDRGSADDLAEAHAAIEWLAALPGADGEVILDITLLRLRALLARGRGAHADSRDLVIRYREMAESLGYQRHIDWAEEMSRGGDGG